jgi:uncharacterized membrane protein (UPF0182 family)
MAYYHIEKGGATRRRPVVRTVLIAAALLLLFGSRTIASYAIEYQWWKEMGQVSTWLSMLTYNLLPLGAATALAFMVLWVSHARALKFAGTGLREHPVYARLSALVLLFVSFVVSAATIDTWTVVRYAGSRGLPAAASAWRDSVFARPLSFYLFDLPFFEALRNYVLALAILSILIYWIGARLWQLRYRFPQMREMQEIDPALFRLEGGLESRFLRGATVVLLVAIALRFFLARYAMVYNPHGTFMVGIDYVDLNIGLPLQWLVIAACLAAAALVGMARWVLAAFMALALVIAFIVPRAVGALYVRPNEISLQRPYITTHIQATRTAFGLDSSKEVEFRARPEAPVQVAEHKALLDNVRLWEWRAFHDTISQIQALRPYYVFADTDVDRYTIDGQYRQVMLSPRELDIRQLPDAQTQWINPTFIYTHGYGLVLAEVARITADGLPVLLIEDAPPQVKTESLKLTRPELYYGEAVHEPVFVNTAQEEFNYPAGADNVPTRYAGTGGFPISSFGMRLAAAIRLGQANILLTDYFTPESRMMIRRKVRERLQTLAAFIQWDIDPYLVITEDGRLVWIIDGYTTSDRHPYSQSVQVANMGRVNYIRNSVKATVDAYNGETRLFIFTPDDPIVLAYARLFPDLFRPASEMASDLRAHVRYSETLFRIQAEIYRTYHMLNPQAFYNKEDVWDLARYVSRDTNRPEPVTPTYVMATLPGQDKAEFLLLLPFTPRNKDNLIGLMVARCDGEALGELVVLQLSKQELIFGPMQIAARINQDQTIAKDLALWNQQGSQVLRGQTLVLPVGETFLYVEPIYIQATEARMPQLRKVVLAVGNRLIYADTYEQGLAQLSGGAQQLIRQASAAEPATGQRPSPAGTAAPPAPPAADARLERVREHLRRYRDFAAQGRWAEAGRELEAIEAEVR